ncbi:NUDIX hydrolase [Arcanobacterium canis]|uniref:CoA pyrophosphatase n=1 Tax=Arcanobacterium canis TaxID=999183 RepID=A0ABY8FXH2_9ACTO|nr:CoA pyrophosphatase [Arcanobacterium canis]WFM83212.1 CoA pyrophosphatase [Arcanobacterium canis]
MSDNTKAETSQDRLQAAVLVLVDRAADPSVVLTRRAFTLRSQPGQMSFPGGMRDAGESAEETALREAWEEISLDPTDVEICGRLAPAQAGNRLLDIVAVLAQWDGEGDITPSDSEVEGIYRIRLSTLARSENRFTATRDGVEVGPAFLVDGLVVWGFTARVLDNLLCKYGYDEPWNTHDVREVPGDFRR